MFLTDQLGLVSPTYTSEFVPIPLTLFPTGSVDCIAWSSLIEVGTNNVRRTFNPQTVDVPIFTDASLVSTTSGIGELRIIDTSARVQCELVIFTD